MSESQGQIPNLRIVRNSKKFGDIDVFNADTGDKLLNVYEVDFNATRYGIPVVKILVDVKVEYEGPALVVDISDSGENE